jgi:hypothetical protein
MGLSISHDSYSGSYAGFGQLRSAWFDAAYGGKRESYEYLRKDVWHSVELTGDVLDDFLTRSDCGDDGPLPVEVTLPLAERLVSLLPRLEAPYREWTEQFIAGLGRAHAMGEVVEFG